MEENNQERPKFEIDGNAIVSPQNTKRLYKGKLKRKLEEDEPEAGQSEEVHTALPDSPDDTDENMFPSAA